MIFAYRVSGNGASYYNSCEIKKAPLLALNGPFSVMVGWPVFSMTSGAWMP